MGSIKRAVKKIARPKVLLPLAAIALGGPALAGAMKGGTAGAALFGKAGAAGTAGGSLIPISKAAALSQGVATPGILGTAGAFAPLKGTLAKGIMAGLKNPFSAKGLMTYGGLGAGALGLMGKEKTEAQKNLGVDAQAQYNLAREMNRMMGGAYTDEQLNTITAPMLSQYGGEYETITGPRRRRRPMFPGLNYSGLTRYAADGGSIKPKKRSEAIDEILNEAEQREIILDALYGGVSPGANEEAMANQMFDLRRRQRLNPMGRKDGGLMQLASAPDPMDERNTMMENLALDKFGKSLDRLKDYEIIQIEEMIENMLPMAMGGSVPQTERIPNGMQLDGRGGGFIPMGAQEKKDDVPAMLAKNEFVMTSDAVKAAGGGDVNKGAQKMYDLMNNLESRV
jgi:hypothetical protein